MSNDYKDRDLGIAAKAILESEVYVMAWEAYRARLFEELERIAGEVDDRAKNQLLARLSVCAAVKMHVERIMKEGAVAAKNIELDERRAHLKKVIG